MGPERQERDNPPGTLGSLSAVTLCVALSQVTPYHCEQGRFTSQVARSLRSLLLLASHRHWAADLK